MRVTQTCTICGSISECSCTGSFVRLFELLSAADQRVSTLKQASAVAKKPPVNVMIDKLTFDLPSPIPEAELKNRLSAAGLSSKLTKLRDRRWYIQVEDLARFLHEVQNP